MLVSLALLCLGAALVSGFLAPRLARHHHRFTAAVLAAAIVPGLLLLIIAAVFAFTIFARGQGDMGDLAAAALILIGLVGAAATFVAGLLAAGALLHYRRPR